jgi:hypothetical protein
MKMNRNFNEFTDFESLELEVPTFCFVTGCVSARRDRRYSGRLMLTRYNLELRYYQVSSR